MGRVIDKIMPKNMILIVISLIAINELPNDPFDEKTWDHWTAKINSKTDSRKRFIYALEVNLTGNSWA